ncbi:MAG: Crp/Fnr family transcriptional regulator [Pseudomonadota bacterium]
MSRILSAPQLGFFKMLPAALQHVLLAAATPQRHMDGETIHRRGDTTSSLSVIREGAVVVSNVGMDGRELALGLLHAGDTFGEFTLFSDMPRQFDFVASGDTRIDVVDREKFDVLLDDSPALARHVISHLASRLHQVVELLDDERRLPLPVRLAKTLLAWPADLDDADKLRVTQQNLANALGVSRVALSGALRRLTEAGWLTRGYGELQLHDRSRLEAWIAANAQLVPTP